MSGGIFFYCETSPASTFMALLLDHVFVAHSLQSVCVDLGVSFFTIVFPNLF